MANQSAYPLVSAIGTGLASIAILAMLMTNQSAVDLSPTLVSYLIAAAFVAMLLGLLGRKRRENRVTCLAAIVLGGIGLALEYTVLAVISGVIVGIMSLLPGLIEFDWLTEIIIGLIIGVAALVALGISLPVLIIGVLALGVLYLLADFLDFF